MFYSDQIFGKEKKAVVWSQYALHIRKGDRAGGSLKQNYTHGSQMSGPNGL